MNKITDHLKPNIDEIAQVRLVSLYAFSLKSLIGMILFAILVTLFLYEELQYNIILWGIAIVFTALLRTGHAYLYRTKNEIFSQKAWYRKFIFFSLMTAVLISLLGFGCLEVSSISTKFFIIAALIGYVSGASLSLWFDIKLALIYIGIIFIPMIVISTTIINSRFSLVLPLLLFLFFVTQIQLIVKLNRQERDLLLSKTQESVRAKKTETALVQEEDCKNISQKIRKNLGDIIVNSSFIGMKADEQTEKYIEKINDSIEEIYQILAQEEKDKIE